MPSVFGHAVTSLALARVFSFEKQTVNFWMLAVYCSVIPDGDVIAFYFGTPYGHLLGHRGLSHSIFFAAIVGFAVAYFFFRHIPRYSRRWWRYAFFYLFVIVCHDLGDALSNGGLGVAFFAPFSLRRYFFAWRPLEVSPIGGLTYFFSWQGWVVIRSELIWIWIPSLALVLVFSLVRRIMHSPRPVDLPEGDP